MRARNADGLVYPAASRGIELVLQADSVCEFIAEGTGTFRSVAPAYSPRMSRARSASNAATCATSASDGFA